MAVYMLFLREGPVQDQDEMAEYQRLTREIKGDYKLTPRVVYGNIEAVEGEAPDGMVMLEFPSVEDAKAWYNSPGYQAALAHRLKAANYRAMIVEGL